MTIQSEYYVDTDGHPVRILFSDEEGVAALRGGDIESSTLALEVVPVNEISSWKTLTHQEYLDLSKS